VTVVALISSLYTLQDDQHMLIQISMPSILEALTHLVTKVRLTAFKMLEQVLNLNPLFMLSELISYKFF
jgi:hypothetical protein